MGTETTEHVGGGGQGLNLKWTGALRVALALCCALASALAAGAEPVLAADGATYSFESSERGEGLLELNASAPGTDWLAPGRESAVATLTLDGRYNQDVVLFRGATSHTYRLALGRVEEGRHTIEVDFNREKSPAGATGVRVNRFKVEVIESDVEGTDIGEDPEAVVQEHSPILYGRNLPEIPGRYENNHTDAPILMYHTVSTAPNGLTTLEYTVFWSNEDGGTNNPALMARWGRTTDVEWVYNYQVTLNQDREIVRELYHGRNHVPMPFTGAKEDRHPLLQTDANNNTLIQVTDPSRTTGYRFFMDPSKELPPNRAREVMMDRQPWTYQIMAKEVIREGRIEPVSDPATPEVSDQRNYLYIEIDKDTTYATPAQGGTWVGAAVVMKLRGSETLYTSHHGIPSWSVMRDIPAATTVELPPGTTEADVEWVAALAVPFDPNPRDAIAPPSDYRIELTNVNRAFFLGKTYKPSRSFITWKGSVVLSPATPRAVIWSASGT